MKEQEGTTKSVKIGFFKILIKKNKSSYKKKLKQCKKYGFILTNGRPYEKVKEEIQIL